MRHQFRLGDACRRRQAGNSRPPERYRDQLYRAFARSVCSSLIQALRAAGHHRRFGFDELAADRSMPIVLWGVGARRRPR